MRFHVLRRAGRSHLRTHSAPLEYDSLFSSRALSLRRLRSRVIGAPIKARASRAPYSVVGIFGQTPRCEALSLRGPLQSGIPLFHVKQVYAVAFTVRRR